MERFACPTPDRQGRYHCIDDHVLCDGFIDCPTGEDEDRQACMFYKTVCMSTSGKLPYLKHFFDLYPYIYAWLDASLKRAIPKGKYPFLFTFVPFLDKYLHCVYFILYYNNIFHFLLGIQFVKKVFQPFFERLSVKYWFWFCNYRLLKRLIQISFNFGLKYSLLLNEANSRAL